MHIEQLKIKNFKVLRDVDIRDIPRFCVIVGKNGSGKSTLFSVFGFLREAFITDVHTAVTKFGNGRGLDEVRSRDTEGDIEIEITFRLHSEEDKDDGARLIYSLKIGEESGRAVVAREVLNHRRADGNAWDVLDFQNGSGVAVTNEEMNGICAEANLMREKQTLKARDVLAIKGLAQFEKFPAAVAVGNFIEQWHFSDLQIGKMQGGEDKNAEHLSHDGENLAAVVNYLHTHHPDALRAVVKKMQRYVPGISDVMTQRTETGRILLKIKDASLSEPFFASYVSDGTVGMLAYLVLLHDPRPHPLLWVEEPEKHLYHQSLEALAEGFRAYAYRGEQVFVSTHAPEFVNAAQINEVFCVVKKDGYSTVVRADDNSHVKAYAANGEKMGYLWQEGNFFNAA